MVVVRDGALINQTLASVCYDPYGSKTNQDLIICDDWIDGFEQAKKSGSRRVLFIDSGTVFFNWAQWIQALERYPHRGLIGHIVWKKTQDTYPWLHPQCWYIEGDLIDATSWTNSSLSSPSPLASDQNIHDDYTPLYLKPDKDEHLSCQTSKFGQNLIAAQLSRQRPVVNWNQKMRGLKHYLYADDPSQQEIWKQSQQEYLELAENQFWILNNEIIQVLPGRRQLSPAAGLHWIINICHPDVDEIKVVDISVQQVEFAQHLWHHWDGEDYGQQVINFIQSKKLTHYEIDRPNLDPLERLKLKNRSYLKKYVNEKFGELTGYDFKQKWQIAQQTKTVTFCVENLVRCVLDQGMLDSDSIWLSNILDYKWTMLNSTRDEIIKFKEIVGRNG